MGELDLEVLKRKRRLQHNKKMKMRRRRTFVVASLILIIIVGICIYNAFKDGERNSNFIYKMTGEEYSNINLKKKLKNYEGTFNINEVNYEWTIKPDTGNNPVVLVYHHSASEGITPEQINKIHQSNGWGGIGYHFFISGNGTIYRGRPENTVGAHAIGANRTSIGICLEGNFEKENLTEQQKGALIKLSVDMIIKYNMKDAIGHKDIYETLCPGKNFNIDEIKEGILSEIKKLQVEN